MIGRYLSALLSIALLLLWMPVHSFADVHTAKASDSDDKQDDKIKEIMDDMTIEEKVGQLFVIHAYGQTPTDEEYEKINLENDRGGKNFKEIIEKYHIGGVIYFNWSENIGTPIDSGQVNDLSNGLQDIAMEQDSSIPLFVSTDQEGGSVQRVQSPGTVFPGNMALGATGSTEYATESADVLGNELQSLGINTDYAPSVDVNVNADNPVIGVRSYSEDPDLVSELGIAQIKGFQNQDIIAAAKHFPGHGDTDTDSHSGLPVIDHDMDTLKEVDLKPFQKAIDAGIDSILTAHIEVPELDDSGDPATLSKPILTELLRDDMGFDGLIVTDSLGMAGVNELYSTSEVPVEAVKAGVDVLLNPPDIETAYNGLLDAVESGDVSEDRIDESVHRILSEKMDKNLFAEPYTDSDEIENVGTDEHLQLADEIAEKSITLVQNQDDVLPLDVDSSDDIFLTGPEEGQPDQLSNHLKEKDAEVDYFATDANPTKGQVEEAVEKAESADKVIVTTHTANTNEEQQQLVKKLKETDTPVIVAGLGTPYDLQAFPDVDAYINTYSDLDVSVKALANVISGDINPAGKLPVTIPDSYEKGHGLDYIDTPHSADGMKTLVSELAETEDIPDNVNHDLTLHLTTVDHYEHKDAADKVVKHMKNFNNMLEVQHDNDALSDKSYSYLETEADKVLDDWEDKD